MASPLTTAHCPVCGWPFDLSAIPEDDAPTKTVQHFDAYEQGYYLVTGRDWSLFDKAEQPAVGGCSIAHEFPGVGALALRAAMGQIPYVAGSGRAGQVGAAGQQTSWLYGSAAPTDDPTPWYGAWEDFEVAELVGGCCE